VEPQCARKKRPSLSNLATRFVRADAVGDVDVARAIPGNVSRLTECRTRRAGASAAAATAGARGGSSTTALRPRLRRHPVCGSAGRLSRPHRDRFRLAPKYKRDISFGVELDDLIGPRPSMVQTLSWGSMRRPIAALNPYTSCPSSRTNFPVASN